MNTGSDDVALADVEGQQTLPDAIAMRADSEDDFTLDIQRWIINLFIIFHLSAVAIWNLPSTALQQGFSDFYKPYMSVTGCWQNWCMFSPDPASVNTYLGATIHYKDGSTRSYTFPRISKLGYIAKYRQERWRKLLENTDATAETPYWPYLARYAAIVSDVSPTFNPVVSVDLYRYSCNIPVPGAPRQPYAKSLMITEHVIAMPSNQPLIGGAD